MNRTLSHIAKIKTGVFAKPEQDGDVVYLQARHFDELGELHEKPFPDLRMTSSIQRHLLMAGDVIVAAKGTKIFASVFRGDFPAVPSTTFIVITPGPDMLPEYLAWILNSQVIQSRLKRFAMGTSLISISKSDLADLELNILSIEKQEKVLGILELNKKEQNLRTKTAELRQSLIQRAINEAIK